MLQQSKKVVVKTPQPVSTVMGTWDMFEMCVSVLPYAKQPLQQQALPRLKDFRRRV